MHLKDKNILTKDKHIDVIQIFTLRGEKCTTGTIENTAIITFKKQKQVKDNAGGINQDAEWYEIEVEISD